MHFVLRSRLIIRCLFVFCLAAQTSSIAIAHSSDAILFSTSSSWTSVSNLTQQEIEERTLAVLNYYQVTPDSIPEEFLNEIENPRAFAEVQKLLPQMDPSGIFSTLSKLSRLQLNIFKDRKTKNVLDFTFDLPPTSSPNRKPVGIRGLRIALDPGHMGGEFWDKVTGKYVKDSKGRILSEGVLNLQICLLLKQELEKLGAQVLLTHTGFAPVTKINYKTFDIKPFARYELLENIHADWFQKLIAKAPAGPKLFALFDQSAEIKKLFSERSRAEYFIKRADLWARADLINQFNADLVMIVHHDTVSDGEDSSGLNPLAPNETKAFIFGSYEGTEFGSSASRTYFVRHLVDKESWDNSLLLSRHLTQRLHQNLGLKLDTSSQVGGHLIEPGVRARNLVLPRMLLSQNVAYMENLFYNRPEEFIALLKPDFKMMIDGRMMTYSKRHLQIVEALRLGIEDFLK